MDFLSRFFSRRRPSAPVVPVSPAPVEPLPAPPAPDTLPARTRLALVILDASGSMRSMRSSVLKFTDELLGQLKARGGPDVFSLVQFNSAHQHVLWRVPLGELPAALPPDSYLPNGGTRLYDTVLAMAASTTPDEPGDLVIMTDGQDSDSLAKPERVAECLGELRRQGWTIRFVEMGIQGVAADLGVRPEETHHCPREAGSFQQTMRQATQFMTRAITAQDVFIHPPTDAVPPDPPKLSPPGP